MNQIILEDASLEFMRFGYDTVNTWVAKHTFPITIKCQARYDLYGSSVGILIAGKKYIATAKHLIDELMSLDGEYFAHTEKGIFSLNQKRITYPNGEGIDYDVCLIEMGDEFEAPTIPHWNFYIGNKLFPSSLQYIQGYPVKKNTPRKISESGFGYFCDQVKFDQEVHHGIAGVSKDTHWIFRHSGGLYGKNPQHLQISGPKNLPSLKGLSGSGMWCLGKVDDISSIKLAGIFTTHENGIGVGTKIKYLKHLALMQPSAQK